MMAPQGVALYGNQRTCRLSNVAATIGDCREDSGAGLALTRSSGGYSRDCVRRVKCRSLSRRIFVEGKTLLFGRRQQGNARVGDDGASLRRPKVRA
jgi:hypothetical protein